MEVRKYKVKLNSIERIEELLQETYDQACKNLNLIQNEISKLENSTNLSDESVSIEEKTKVSKAIHDFVGDQSKAISLKLEIAKFMGEIIKHGGSVEDTLNDKNVSKRTSMSLSSLRAELSKTDTNNDTDSYTFRK